MMNDEAMQKKLKQIKKEKGHILTLKEEVRNDIVHVDEISLKVKSSRTRTVREITFNEIRNHENATKHGCIIRAIAKELGL